jgi:hypothetical protein
MANNLLALSGGTTSDIGENFFEPQQRRLNNELNRDIATNQDARRETAAGTREEANQFKLGQARENQKIQSIGEAAQQLLPALKRDPVEAARMVERRLQDLNADGTPSQETLDAQEMLLTVTLTGWKIP